MSSCPRNASGHKFMLVRREVKWRFLKKVVYAFYECIYCGEPKVVVR